MPGNKQDTDSQEHDRPAVWSASRARHICDLCGSRIKPDGGFRALVSTSAGRMDARAVVACSREHLEELIKKRR